jgi:hypothetical protein
VATTSWWVDSWDCGLRENLEAAARASGKRKRLDAFAFGKDTTGFDGQVASFGEDVLDDMI